MKRQTICLLLAGILFLLPLTANAATSFKDVSANFWAYEYIQQMANDGILGGYSDGTFLPDVPMTRGEFAKVLSTIQGLDLTNEDSIYSDVNGHWAKKYIVSVSDEMLGVSNTEFGPEAVITREAAIAAIIESTGYDFSQIDVNGLLNQFTDFFDTSVVFQPYLACGVENNIIGGYEDNTIRPKSELTRAEACALLYKGFYYEIDTIAANLYDFRSMVMNNAGDIYYIDGSIIYNTKNTQTLNLATDFALSLSNPYLCYDYYYDIVYLLAGGSLTIYDITDFSAPKLVLDDNNCPALTQGSGRSQLAYTSMPTPQISVLENGSLLIPFESSGTGIVNPQNKTIISGTPIYSLLSPYYAKVIDGQVVTFRAGDSKATIQNLNSETKSEIEYNIETPDNKCNSLCAKYGYISFYLDSIGVCLYDINEGVYVLIPQEHIKIKDYQSLDYTNIWGIDMSLNDYLAFYDNSLKCIRLIKPAR